MSEEERQFNVFLILGLFLCILLSGVIANHINTPLNRVKERLRQIGAGDFKKEFKIKNRDELGRIGDGIQEMALNLARLYAEQEALFQETNPFLSRSHRCPRSLYPRPFRSCQSVCPKNSPSHGPFREREQGNFSCRRTPYIGKVGIREDVLNYDGPLDQEKYAHMKTHPEIGARILGVVKDFERIRVMVRAHHEHYDGSGYPDGQKGLETPLGARIIAVADVYDALTTDRPYRAAWKKEKALQVIQEKAGSQFDPLVVPRSSFSHEVSHVQEPGKGGRLQQVGIEAVVPEAAPLLSALSRAAGPSVGSKSAH